MQDSWLKQKAEEIQNYADKNDMKRFYDAIKTVYGPQPASSSPLLSADGQKLLTEKAHILDRWAEHFDAVLNRSSHTNEEAINRLPQNTINLNMGNPPTLSELEIAIHQLSSGKAPGADAIPAEVYKHTGPLLRNKLKQLIDVIWDQEIVPQEFKDASIIHLYKRKGNRQVCDNHRGISLLCIAGKILARILLNRLIDHLEQGLLPESQCGFRKERGTTDMLFAARQLQEKCQEQNVDLYTTFVDLTKAFDTVSRDGLWKIMSKFIVSLWTKLSVYKAIVLTTLLYASETWTVYQRHAKKLNRFHLNCLRKLLRVKWQDKVPDTEILEQTGMSSIFTMLRKTQLCWAGHVVRMPDERLPKRILYGELLTGARSHGGQKKRFKDTLKASLKDFGIDHNLWETSAQNRAAWRGVINKGAAAYDSRRLETAKSKRATLTRKSRASSAPGTHDPTALPCPHCPRTFKAKIGLISHLRTHPTPRI